MRLSGTKFKKRSADARKSETVREINISYKTWGIFDDVN